VARPPRLLVAAAVAVLLIAAGAGGYLLAPRGDANAVDVSTILSEPGARLVHFGGTAQGNLAIAYQPGLPDVYVLGSALQQPPSGKTYELWMFRGNTPVSGGCFVPNDGQLLEHVDADLSGTDSMAVTVEPNDCPSGPSTQPILSAQL
ncbi:MAG: anti-sigma factor, partial [Actinomycetota bacterium]|nr:anti-sigma factor [Actinomycetota bacterium]